MNRPPFALLASLTLALCATGQSVPQFTDVTAATGINVVHTDLIDTMAGGVCFLDYDNDGFPDLFVTSRGGGRNQLYHNERNGTFVDVSATARVDAQRYSMGAYAADLDNDGWQDLLVLLHGGLILYRNNRDGTFTDVTVGSGLVNPHWACGGTLGDYDRDGMLDIFIGNYVEDGFFPYFQGAPDKLFHNDGGFKFRDVSRAAGVEGWGPYRDPRGGTFTYGTALSSLFFDYDADGWPDIFVGNDFGVWIIPNQLLRNNRDGTFTDVSAIANFAIPEFNMGLATADVNGDQVLDLYTANLGPNHLMFNDGRGRFRDMALPWGAQLGYSSNLFLTSWAIMFLDVDLDRRPDLYVSTGFIKTIKELDNDPLAPKRLLYHMGSSYGIVPPPQFPLDQGVGRGAARGDIDGDGDEDLVQLNNRQPLRVYRNDTPRVHQTVILDLLGNLSNRDGVGAHLKLRTIDGTQVREHNRGGSYMSCDASSIVMGLRNEHEVEELTVRWPSGVVNRRIALGGDRRHVIVEPTVTIASIERALNIAPDWIEVPVTVENHAATSEPVSLRTAVAFGGVRVPFPSLSPPVTLGARARVTVPVYVPIPYAAIPVAQRLGVWFQVTATSRIAGVDQVEAPLR